MRRALICLCATLLLASPVAWAQQATNSDSSAAIGTDLASQAPADNVKGGAVSNRAPGRIVEQAIARHRDRASTRLGAQRTGETWLLAPESTTSGGSSSSNPLSSLLGGGSSNLISTLLNGGLGSALGSLTGSSGSGLFSGSSATSGSGNAGSTGSSGINTSNLPPEVIAMLQGAGIDINSLNAKSRDGVTDTSVTQTKTSTLTNQTSDQTPTEERSFLVRWADSMLSTMFTALTVGLQTSDFINLIKDAFRPVFFPDSADTTT